MELAEIMRDVNDGASDAMRDDAVEDIDSEGVLQKILADFSTDATKLLWHPDTTLSDATGLVSRLKNTLKEATGDDMMFDEGLSLMKESLKIICETTGVTPYQAALSFPIETAPDPTFAQVMAILAANEIIMERDATKE